MVHFRKPSDHSFEVKRNTICEYRQSLRNPVGISFRNMAVISLWSVLVNLSMPLLAAELIFSLRREGWRYFLRSVFIVPMVVPTVGTLLIWRYLYSDAGPITRLLEEVGLDHWIRAWLSDPAWALPAVLATGFPYVSGFFVLIYYAGLSSIPEDVLDAARLDGAGWWTTVRRIHVPHLLPQMKIISVLAVITAAQNFENILILTNDGGPGYATMVPGLYMYLEGFDFKRMGYACAIGIVLFAVLFIFTFLNLRFVRRRGAQEVGHV